MYSVVCFRRVFGGGLSRFYAASNLTLSEALAMADKYRRDFVYPPNGGLHSVGIEQQD